MSSSNSDAAPKIVPSVSDSDSDAVAPPKFVGSVSDSDDDSSSAKSAPKSATTGSDSDDFEPTSDSEDRESVKKQPSKADLKKKAKKKSASKQQKNRNAVKSAKRSPTPRGRGQKLRAADEYVRKAFTIALKGHPDAKAFKARLQGLALTLAAQIVEQRETEEGDSSTVTFQIPQVIFDEVPATIPSVVVSGFFETVTSLLILRKPALDKKGEPKMKEDGTPETRQVFKYKATLESFSTDDNTITLLIK